MIGTFKQIAAAVIATVLLALNAHAQDAAEGQRLFQQRCGACHQIDSTRNGVGPHLQGVIGRAAGSVDGFRYSSAMQGSGITRDAVQLDTYLTNPGALVKGTRMTQRFPKVDERKAIIDFLATR
ncbi:c-type cytochrome [Rhizobium rhizophilum]|uniref:Cytochrome c family protein n=1 Tax=Rhizobium rhizophilum TaxID=1850373 RepID=A0ABY2QQU9_9HYPH|nr:cytochrome c family protein [Rhizobium rhizophilum]THV12390.1 cytochrome c family protein [Rhizobium rhizophilum]